YLRVGASKPQKTNVRVVAATNENMQQAILKGKFREDLFYRLNTIPIALPALRDRGDDIHLLFRKFASDFADRYRMPPIRLTEEAIELLNAYRWPGNIRQLKNMVEQLSIIETERSIDRTLLQHYLPEVVDKGALMINTPSQESISEREIMYKFLFDMKRDLTDLKKLVVEILSQTAGIELDADQNILLNKLYQDFGSTMQSSVLPANLIPPPKIQEVEDQEDFTQHEDFEESLSLEERERELIQKALEKHRGKRKYAAKELGISERTLYRKIKEFNLAE
ncbi:MAG: helix-turn-helix domain-containing protein, partial [Bacteroidota bacterium]